MLKPEVESLVPGQSFDRRSFVKTALGSAFAAAVLPVHARPSRPISTA
jgi:carboxymethylenebutenolidase